MQSITDKLRELDFDFLPDFSGKMQRFDRNGKSLNGWAIGRLFDFGDKIIQQISFGDWATGEKYSFTTGDESLSAKEKDELTKKIEAQKEELRREQIKEQGIAAHEAIAIWSNCLEAWEATPYENKKRIVGCFGVKRHPIEDALIIPIRDVEGQIWSLQKIYADGKKQFMPGGRIKGCFHTIGELKDGERIYIAEGYATGASIFLATGCGTVCAFTAGNLSEVSIRIREKYPNSAIILCADNDQWTTDHRGKAINPGKEKAQDAAKKCRGSVRIPVFRILDSKPTDFNDLHVLEGLSVVKEQLEAGAGDNETASPPPPVAASIVDSSNDGDKAGIPIESDSGKSQKKAAKKDIEMKIVSSLVDHFGNNLLKNEKDLFHYDGQKWSLMTGNDIDGIKVQIMALYDYKARSKDVESAYKSFLYFVPKVPKGIDMFSPHPWAANFQNGTLWIERRGPKKYELIFKPHSREDYLINVLPFEYKPDWSEKNTEFEAMLVRVFEGEEDIEQKIRSVRQMYGACLIAAFPHLFFLYGPPGTGKSTVMKIAARLIHSDNLCSVEPQKLDGFNMETMAGKLVNMDTDVDVVRPIADAVIKKIEDRVPMRISRKSIKDIYAPLPAIHIFGGNDVPRTLEGTSRAHDRRWTFIGFNKVVAKGDYDKAYDQWCFEQSPQGVLNFALYGLQDLLECGGHFSEPESGKAKKELWQLKNDPVGLFLKDIDEGEVLDNNTKVMRVKNGKIKRGNFWKIYKIWVEDVSEKSLKPEKHKFFDQLRSKGIVDYKTNGDWYFPGFDVGAGAGADQ